MRVERSAEAVDEAHCTQPPIGAVTGIAQSGFDGAQQDVQHGTECRESRCRK